MARRKPKDDASESLAEALDDLDKLHASIIKMALDADTSPIAENELTSDKNDDLPESRFDVGDMNAGPERGGGVVLDTRLTLTVDDDLAEALLFALMRKIREGGDLVELELDGRFVIGSAAAKDFRAALKSGS